MIDRDDDVNGYGVDYGQLDDARGYCKHGAYVGGCGADFMCGYCEDGLDQWYPETYYHHIMVYSHKDDRTRIDSYTGPARLTREEAERDCDMWEEAFNKEEGIVALYVYPRQGGYWGEREREKEHHVEVWDDVRSISYGVYFRFDKELDHLREQVALINEHNGEQRFYITEMAVPFDVYEVSRFMQELVERNNDEV